MKHDSCHVRKSSHPEKIKNGLIGRLNRIEGQVRGLRKMVEQDVYCDDILNQISSVQAALGGTADLLLEYHVKGCVVDRIREGDKQVIDEVLSTIRKFTK